MVDFNAKKIEKYAEQIRQQQFKKGAERVVLNEFNTDAILFFFDRNKDGKISKQEFEQVSKENYSLFAKDLAKYNASINDSSHIYTYEELNKFLEDGIISNGELNDNPKKRLDENLNLPEQKHLKNIPQMSEEEIQTELALYNKDKKDAKMLRNFRKERNNIDQNSDVVDWHIGTFNQGSHHDCSLLARIENLSDEDLKNIYCKKQDKKGNIYYEVNFPSDNNKKTVKITQEELDYMAIKYKGDEITGFSTGDKDVLLLEMAYIKRYGKSIIDNGLTLKDSLLIFTQNKEIKEYNEISEEQLINNKVKSLCLLSTEQLKHYKNIDNEEVVLDSGAKARLFEKNGDIEIVGQQRLKLPDGTLIYGKHAYAVKSYNPETKELVLSNPAENSTDIVVPFEALKLFYIAE